MKLGIISDTHNQKELIKKALEVFRNERVEMIIHAGDMDLTSTLDEFKDISVPLKMAIGNIDEEPERFPERAKKFGLDFEINSFLNLEIRREKGADKAAGARGREGKKALRFFVFHGNVLGKLDDVIKTLVESRRYDVIIHGHTHKPRNEEINGVRILNPGSLDPISAGVKPSVMVYDVGVGEAEIIKF